MMTNFILPAILVLLAHLLVYPLAPIAALFADKAGRLSKMFRWMETHDNPGWSGPLSEGFPSTKWGLCRWLWRNKAYALRDKFRATPTEVELNYAYHYLGSFVDYYRIGDKFLYELTFRFRLFKVFFSVGWKLKPYFNGHRPIGKTATGIIIPFSIRTDDYDE